MKWFWRINYILTVYGFIVFVVGFVNLRINCFTTLSIIDTIISFNKFAYIFTMILEWIQFPLCLIVVLFWKKERTSPHFFYLILIIFLNLAKWILVYGSLVGLI